MIIYPWISRKYIDIDIEIQYIQYVYISGLCFFPIYPFFESRSSGDGRWILAAWVSVTRPPEFFLEENTSFWDFMVV